MLPRYFLGFGLVRGDDSCLTVDFVLLYVYVMIVQLYTKGKNDAKTRNS